jgi:hypothetical protein
VKWFFRRVQSRVLAPESESVPLLEDEGVAVENAPHGKVCVLLDQERGSQTLTKKACGLCR